MKKIILSLFALAMASSLFAQEDVKAVFEAGKAEFAKFDTLYTQKAIGQPVDEKAMGEALVNCYELYFKALPLDSMPNEKGKIKPKYSKEIIKTLGENYNDLLTCGQALWDSKDYMACYKCWNLYTSLPTNPNPEIQKALKGKVQSDSVTSEIVYFQGLAAWQADELDLALERFDEAYGRGFDQESLFNYGMSVSAQAAQKAEQAGKKAEADAYNARIIDFAEKAFQRYGTKDIKYIGFIINDKIDKKDFKGAIDKLNTAIAANPTNGQLYDVLGVVYENSDGDAEANYNEALKNYLKAVEYSPDDAKSNYDLGRIYYNRAGSIEDASAQLSRKEYEKVRNEQILPLCQQAMPYAEKALNSDPDNQDYKLLMRNLEYKLGIE